MTIEEDCKTLGIDPSMKDDFGKIKAALYKKITAPLTYRKDRIEYNLAFQNLCNRIFNTEPNSEEKKLIDAIYKGDLNQLERLFKSNPGLINYRRPFFNYPLIYLATKSGHYDVVQLVLKSGCSLDFSKDRSTPMDCATFYGFREIIPLLFKYGIPTKIKNFSDSYPEEQAFDISIQKLILTSKQDLFSKLVENLTGLKLVLEVLNLSFREEKGQKIVLNQRLIDVKKIILKGYFDYQQGYVDAFHGTKFEALESISLHGLRPAGSIVDGKNFQNWSNAIFVSPSIYYAGDPIYSKTVMIDGQSWSPIVQVRVKNNTYSSHEHTLVTYNLKDKQPELLEFRVKCDEKKENSRIFRNQDSKNVKVIALLLVRTSFLFNQNNYQRVTNFILKSQCQRNFSRKHNSFNSLFRRMRIS